MSLPVVIIVHGNQAKDAWATIVWENAFIDLNKGPFEVSNSGSWSKLADALNFQFTAATERSLTKENLNYFRKSYKEKNVIKRNYLAFNVVMFQVKRFLAKKTTLMRKHN